MIYEWKTNYFKTDPNVAGAVFKELENTVGLTPKTIVDASRPVDAPLHREFEWRDDVAAEKWRQNQARTMMANLTVIINEKQEDPVKAFVTLDYQNRTKYESIDIVLSDSEKRTKLFELAMKELITFQKKYRDLEQFDALFAEIRRLQSYAG